jgi:hypothetical protein
MQLEVGVLKKWHSEINSMQQMPGRNPGLASCGMRYFENSSLLKFMRRSMSTETNCYNVTRTGAVKNDVSPPRSNQGGSGLRLFL